jgi:hypothetical protein
MARVVDIVVCEDQVPFSMRGDVCGTLRSMQQARDFAHAVGRDKKPVKPLMLFGPDEYVPILVIGDGVTEAAEMADLAEEAIGRQQENVKKWGRGFNFDEARERRGMIRREDFGPALAEAFARRAQFLRANQVTQGK